MELSLLSSLIRVIVLLFGSQLDILFDSHHIKGIHIIGYNCQPQGDNASR